MAAKQQGKARAYTKLWEQFHSAAVAMLERVLWFKHSAKSLLFYVNPRKVSPTNPEKALKPIKSLFATEWVVEIELPSRDMIPRSSYEPDPEAAYQQAIHCLITRGLRDWFRQIAEDTSAIQIGDVEVYGNKAKDPAGLRLFGLRFQDHPVDA